MNIIVAIKQVPNTNDVRIDPLTGTLVREGIPSIVNPDDLHAVEGALQLREKFSVDSITAISMGPPMAELALREVLSMGVDKGILLSDRTFAGADTLATAATLALAISRLKPFDLILCGRQAIDGDTAQVGPQLAESLGIPHLSCVEHIEIHDGVFCVRSRIENGIQVASIPSPALFTCVKEIGKPRIPTLSGCMAAFREKPFLVWKALDISAPPESIGLKGSPTQVRRTFTPLVKKAGVVLEGSPANCVNRLIHALQEKNIL